VINGVKDAGSVCHQQNQTYSEDIVLTAH